ncbi:MAG: hypothetical protein WCE21_05580 [Candidatus Babeliales bacterium]
MNHMYVILIGILCVASNTFATDQCITTVNVINQTNNTINIKLSLSTDPASKTDTQQENNILAGQAVSISLATSKFCGGVALLAQYAQQDNAEWMVIKWMDRKQKNATVETLAPVTIAQDTTDTKPRYVFSAQ